MQIIDQTQWAVSIESVDSAKATAMLEGNFQNRSPRKSTIAKYATQMLSGQWQLTTEPIVIAKNGRLLNGQHRLMAIVKSETVIDFLVIRNVDESVFKSIDRGMTRTFSDATGVDRKLSEVAKLACISLEAMGNPSDSSVMRVAEKISAYHSRLMEAAPASAKFFSSVPMRLAAVLCMMKSDRHEQFAISVYRSMIHGDVSNLPGPAASMVKMYLTGSIKSGGRTMQEEILARALKVMDLDSKDHATCRPVSNNIHEYTTAVVRSFLS